MRPPPTRIGKGGPNRRTKASILRESTSSEIAAMSKSLRSNSRYSCAIWGNSSRHGSHHEAQKLTSVTLPANCARVTVSPRKSGSAKAGVNGSRLGDVVPASRLSASNVARFPRASTATAVSRGPRWRVARIAPLLVSTTSTRKLVAAESSDPNAYRRPSGPSASATLTRALRAQEHPAERRHRHRVGEARAREAAGDAEPPVERD